MILDTSAAFDLLVLTVDEFDDYFSGAGRF